MLVRVVFRITVIAELCHAQNPSDGKPEIVSRDGLVVIGRLPEPEIVDHIVFVRFQFPHQIEIQPALREVRLFVPRLVFLVHGIAAQQPDIQACQTLLSVDDCIEIALTRLVADLVHRSTAAVLLIIADEVIEPIVHFDIGREKSVHALEKAMADDKLMFVSTQKDDNVLIPTFDDIYAGTYYTVGRAARDANGNIIGYIFAFSDATSITVFSNALLSIFMVCAGVMLLISSAVSILVTGRLTTPLRNISEAAKKFSQGDFSARVKVEGDDEIAHLSYTFNQMASFVEKNEKSRSSFVANIAHELRTPMTSIKGFVDGIRDGTIPPRQQDKYLAVISDEVGRLARLTNSMLDISKLESGEFMMNVQNYNIWDTIAAVAFSFESRMERAEIQLIGFEPQKVMVYADKDIIHQVVYNIFDNALKFTPKGGYIAFSVTEEKATNSVMVKIKNSGQGISKEALPYIFDRFYKADASRSVHTRGAGIGLFISKTLVQRSGGDIYVESEEGQYTQFIFTLPSGKAKGRPKEKNTD